MKRMYHVYTPNVHVYRGYMFTVITTHTFTSSYVRATNDVHVLTFHVPYLSSLSPLSGTADVTS